MQCCTNLLTTELYKPAISNKGDVLLHEVAVHANESNRESVTEELLLNGYSIRYNLINAFLRRLMGEVLEKKAGKLTV